MKRSLSGIQPSGILHLGNYFGAISQFVKNQNSGEFEGFYFIADYHSLTSLTDPKSLKENTYNIVLDYLALGLDPDKSTIFLQSDIPEHVELSWLLSNVTPVGLLERGHSYKDKIAKGFTPNAGLMTYPVLMAADILIYDTDIVPVGKDQKQHLEMTRDIAMKFNQQYGVELFKLPDPLIMDDLAVIPGTDGQKMSKSKGNVVSPDALVNDYGCDSLRMYELFVGPPELDAEWDDRGIDGVNRFLKRLWNLLMDSKEADVQPTKEMIKLRHKMVYDITNRLESFSLNTVISGFMEYNNKFIEMAKKEGGIDKETLETIAVLLSPFAPHFAEEMWEQLGHGETIFKAGWPSYDESAMKDDEIEVPVQINGKTRAVISISADASKDEAIAAGKEAVADKLTGTIVKEIYVPKKIINIVQK